ncbi:hypothetical protein MPSEU_000927800 [Mayamaea pseudoterrestris]|nr:hypothetical protein MPSEU_000927800 [Mayamaea pseudoterrestris]
MTMLGAAARSTRTLGRRGLQKLPAQNGARRGMAGGHYMTVSENHRIAGEVFGTVCWLWVFHRASHDLPVVLGWRHPWEHAPGDDHGHEHHGHVVAASAPAQIAAGWEKAVAKMTNFNDDDDDDDDEEDEE